MSGIEAVGIALAVFPLVINLLEHYQDGYDTLRDYAHFRREFTHLVNELNREQIIFRQHVEGTLRSITESEFELKEMMDDARSERWRSPHLALELQRKLCGDGEYENYRASMWAIHDNLETMSTRLKAFEISGDSVEGTKGPAPMGHRLQQRFRKLHFVMRKKKWRQQIVDLGRQIDRVGKLFGEAQALAPARQSRGSRTHQAFGHVRSQASSLHKAITDAFACACETPHAFKLILAKPPKIPSSWLGGNTPSRILKVSFPLCSRAWTMPRIVLEKHDAWRSFNTTMVSVPETDKLLLAESSFGGSRSSISSSSRDGQSSMSSRGSISTRTDATSPLLSTSPGCSPSCLGPPLADPLDTFAASLSAISGRPIPIRDLCGTIRTESGSLSTGYLDDGRGSYHILSTDPEFSFTSAEINRVISLREILVDQDSALEDETTRAGALPRRQRMSIALALAYALLELYPTPWMPRSVRRLEVYFFQRKDGKIMIDNPFFLCESSLPPQQPNKQQEAHAYEEFVDDSNALLALGIVIMELWFGQTIESRSFYKDYCDETGKEKAFTSFTAAMEWQKKTIDEAGVTLHDITNRCIRGNFGEPTMDLSNGSCVKAVHDQVVKPLEGMLGYIWPVKGAV